MAITYHTQECDFTFRGRARTSAWIKSVAQAEGMSVGALAVVFCSDPALLNVNREYLGHDYFTDIITFDESDQTKHQIAGDLMISVDTVRENALQFSEPFDRELHRVIIHGVLHLVGYGDQTASDQTHMRALEDRYLELFEQLPTRKR